MEAIAMASGSLPHGGSIELQRLATPTNRDSHDKTTNNEQQQQSENTTSQPTVSATNGALPEPEQERNLGSSRIAVIMLSLSASVFVSALDITIISTASPGIASYFRSASGYTWIGSSYTLANTATTPTWGKMSDIWGRKPLLLAGLVIFFVGSVVCALADSIGLLLAGRTIQGVGSAGLNTLVNICVGDLFALRDRGLYFGLLSVVWAFASGVGPVLGGVFSEKLSSVGPFILIQCESMADWGWLSVIDGDGVFI
jgi:MFS family permease